jgi:transposase
VSYTDRSEQAQQEQLDWLHQIHEQEAAQTAHLARIAKHTGLMYVLAVIWIVLVGIYLLAQLYNAVH